MQSRSLNFPTKTGHQNIESIEHIDYILKLKFPSPLPNWQLREALHKRNGHLINNYDDNCVDDDNDDNEDDDNDDNEDDDSDDNGLLSVLTLRRRLTHSVHTARYHSSLFYICVALCCTVLHLCCTVRTACYHSQSALHIYTLGTLH